MVMFDSLNRHMLNNYGCKESITPNFLRLEEKTVKYQTCYAASLPCMPARRELHTGRYNFLHRSWGPMEPFDDSMPQMLSQNGIHSHLVSDHGHYWEDGGATYHTRYSTWECHRGQEGDPWKAVVGGIEDKNPNLIKFKGYREKLYKQDNINRSFVKSEEDFPQNKTFEGGLDFLKQNHDKDNWFLHLECFDPHEPFFSSEKFREMYPTTYKGERYDWPDYAPVKESESEVMEARREYMALLTMCDYSLGKVIDFMDEHDMWEDTMLIVNTDHGYMLGEHGFWAKNYMPLYEEITHIPLFVWDPRTRQKGISCKSLVQSIDLPATILGLFGIEKPKDMLGQDIINTADDKEIRQAALFGIHGSHLCVTDGRYVYMKSPSPDYPSMQYTLMPTNMVGFFSDRSIKTMQRQEAFSFTKDMPVMKMESFPTFPPLFGDLLFDLKEDPNQYAPIEDKEVKAKMENYMKELLKENDAPKELYGRFSLKI